MPIRPEMKDRYPEYWDWLSEFIRNFIAQQQCQWCGALNGEPHPITGSTVVLTVAHIYDHRPENTNFDNLAALCQRCHLNHDRPRHIEQRRRTRDKKRGQGRLEFEDEELAQ